ncbi:Calmodulin-binding domain, plant [Dillenia turbinata]|uniref:Calmodulin-binding domain, plant n=1 Tax=Dillenia turbinata TaxID=194707 RepID=A0AAN8YTI2_9MAGN
MATTTTRARRGTSPSNSHVVDTAQRRTAPPVKHPSTTTPEQKQPHYLRQTISSSPSSLKYVKKEDNIHKQASLNRRKSSDQKLPSPSQSRQPSPIQTPKSSPSQTLSHNKIGKPSPPLSSKTTPSSKPNSERTSRPSSQGKSQPLGTRTRYVKKGTVPSIKKETKASHASTLNNVEEHYKEVLVHDEKDVKDDVQEEVETEMAKPEREEPGEEMDTKPEDFEEEKILEVESSPATEEEHEESPHAPVEEIKDVKEVTEEQPEVKEEHKSETQPEAQNSTSEPEPESEHEPAVVQKQEDIPIEISDSAEKEKAEEKKEESSEGDQKATAEAIPASAPVVEQIRKPAETNQSTAVAKRAYGKKDTQAYNDVIEETARKLVEKRKSKVLALAGAFETVISLQDPETTSTPTQAAK